MTYKALYRTYRPQSFEAVIGQDAIVRTLRNSLKTGKISHAYLFCGPRGTGKTSVARIFAKALCCPNREGTEPCNDCRNCREITEAISPDVIEIDAASNNGVDEIRDLKDKVNFLPAGSRYKIYIVDEVHMLTAGAFNALLKTLEEPPAHAVFILATTEPNKVLPTIISRCQRFDFKELTEKEIIGKLEEVCAAEKTEYDREALEIIASAGKGAMRDALSFLDRALSLSDDKITAETAITVTGVTDRKTLFAIIRTIEEKRLSETLEIIETLLDGGHEAQTITEDILDCYRDVLLSKLGIATKFEAEEADFIDRIDIDKVYYYIDVLNGLYNKLRFGGSPKIYLEVAIIKMAGITAEELDYGKRLSEAEKRIASIGTNSGIADPKRLRLLEEKFDNLMNELSKTEFVKVNERITALEREGGSGSSGDDCKIINGRIDKIVEDLELLKVIQNGIRSELDNIPPDMKSASGSKTITDTEEIERMIKKHLGQLESRNGDYRERLESLEERIEEKERDRSDLEESIDDLEGRIDDLEDSIGEGKENKIYDSQETGRLKKIIADLDERTEKLEKIVESKASDPDGELNERLDKIESNVYKLMSGILNATPTRKKKTKADVKQISFWHDDMVETEKLVKPAEIVKTDFDDLALPEEEISQEKESEPAEPEKESNIFNHDLSELENATVEEEKKEETETVEKKEEPINLFIEESAAKDGGKEEKQKAVYELDEFERYDAKVLERIMNDARNPEYGPEKERLVNLWKHLVELTPLEDRGIAEILTEGAITAVGNHEFVLVYDNSAVCNQIMGGRFKRKARKLLFDFLSGDYNYFAITREVWIKKRREYSDQYSVGTKYPTLSPIDDPSLQVVPEDEEDDNETMMRNIRDLFGGVDFKK